ncbi:Integrase core domain [Actinomyces howellii]|uniref:Integrase core domain n=1 Tax=Actinomyces howellii TaxID=52771 RepID=A0A3S4T9J3_9ACTO|nr:Integrase core domain [Actinomyces howellii]
MTSFCRQEGINRKTFYAIRARARSQGQAAALEPGSTRPASSPPRISDQVGRQALEVRASLEASGLDHGPVSVHGKMTGMDLQAPSPASLARVFRREDVSRPEPRKRPRAAWRRFVYPAPNACWQMDATEYVLAGGRKAVIFQLIDDHSRLAVASLAADAETSQAAIEVFDKGVAAHGVPQRLLTDNGAALNPTRRGQHGRPAEHVGALGVEPITSKPYHPTTQGKNERPHQALPGRITPQQAWDTTPAAEPPRPPADRADEPVAVGGLVAPALLTPGQAERTIAPNGLVHLKGIRFLVSHHHSHQRVAVTWDTQRIIFATAGGRSWLSTPSPSPAPPTPPTPPTVTQVLRLRTLNGFGHKQIATKQTAKALVRYISQSSSVASL